MLQRQTLIALVVAVVIGLVAVYLANSFLSGSQRRAELNGTTKVAVAAVPMTYGSDITADKIRFVEYPNRSIPPGAFANAAQLLPGGKKRFALIPISVNEPILATKISAEGQGASISALLPDGMRAATVRINDVSGVAGFIQPNDHVDVLITRTAPGEGERGTKLTDVLLQNTRVIAMGRNAKGSDGKPISAKTATLEVNPLDAQKLALGEAAGSLSLVLRKPGEKDNPVVETISLNDLRYNIYGGARYPAPAAIGSFGGLGSAVGGSMQQTAAQIASAVPARPRPPAARKPAAKPAAKKGNNIEIFRGTTGNQYSVGG
jgi:pilus assembly protein CpaB